MFHVPVVNDMLLLKHCT